MFDFKKHIFFAQCCSVLFFSLQGEGNLPFTAMNGQDRYAYETFFHNKKNGVFIEIGAFTGINMSTSYVFEKLGWSGICIEASPISFLELAKNRNCVCLNVAVGKESGTTKFLHFVDMPTFSGMYDYVFPNSYENLQKHSTTPLRTEIIEIPVKPLMQIFKEQNIQEVDFLSIDVEGAELDILKTIDFDAIKIKVICAESNHPGQIAFLIAKGYTHYHSIKEDDFFVRNDFLRAEK